jgi:uncharacterized protein
MSEIRGTFIWYDLNTTDEKGAKAFYTEVIGWGTEEWNETGMPYTMLKAGDQAFGGLMTLPEEARQMGAPPHWIAYVGTPDVDASAAQVKELGGQIYAPPMDIPKVGRFAVVADPQGAVIALFKPAPSDEPWSPPSGPGSISWRELMTSDLEAAWSFYEKVFGWEKQEAMDMGPAGLYQLYGRPGGEMLGGMMQITPDMGGMPPTWLYYVEVDDLDATLERVAQKGGQVMNGPMEVPGGDRVAQCIDPQGANFALHSVKK